MLQLVNTSPFAATLLGLPNREGVETIFVVVKGTFEFAGSEVRVAEEQRAVALADEYRGEPGASSLACASEAHVTKPGTDVVVVGDACALDESPVLHVDVGVGVGDQHKHARVHGDRFWTEGLGGMRPSGAKPFVRIPVVYERAFGGRYVPDPTRSAFIAEPRNPVGCGFLGKRSAQQLLGQPAPNIEDLCSPIGAPGSRGKPIGFGPIAPSWEPRVHYGGTYDEAWQTTRAPYLPDDFDPRFFNIAPEELVFGDSLSGGEPVALRGFHPCGIQRFDLPRCELEIVATLAGQAHTLPYRLETVVLEPTDERFSLTFRASLTVDKQLLRVEEVAVSLQRVEGLVEEQRSA